MAYGVNQTYHVPGNMHGQSTPFSFSDGHAETHKWQNAKFNNPKLPSWHNHSAPIPGVNAAEVEPDFRWLGHHATEYNR